MRHIFDPSQHFRALNTSLRWRPPSQLKGPVPRTQLFLRPIFCQILIILLIGLKAHNRGFSQSAIIDSLQNLLPVSQEDSSKVNILNGLSSELIDSARLPEAKFFANQALALSQKIGYLEGKGIAFVNLGNVFSDEGEHDEAMKFYESGLKSKQLLQDRIGISECYENIGLEFWYLSQFFESLKNHNLALSIRKELKDSIKMAYSYQNIGNVFIEMGLYSNAAENYFKALIIFEKKGLKFRVADIYNNLGAVYWHQNDHNESVKCFQTSLNLLKELNNVQRTANALSNLGNVCFAQNKLSEALEYYNSALEVRQKYKDSRGVAISYLNIGAVYQKQNDHREALKYFFHVLSLSVAQKYQDGISAAQLNIGIAYRAQSKYQKARTYIKRSLEISKEIGMVERIRDGYQELSVLDSIQGRWKESFANFKLYKIYHDSLINERNTTKIVQLREGYKYDKQKELDILKHENELMTLEDRTRHQRTIWIVVFSATLLIGFFSVNFWRRKKEYLFEKKLSGARQEALNAQMSDHFISNTIDSINNFIEQNEKEKASEYLLLFHRLIRRVLEHSFQKLVPLESDLEVLRWYFELEQLRFKEQNLFLQINIDDEIDPQNTLIPPLIFQTLAENSIRHGFKKSQKGIICISVKDNQGMLDCSVEDNGIGRSAAVQSREVVENGHVSYGSHLAERLVTLSAGIKNKDSYRVVDLCDTEGRATGTKVEFRLPLLPN